jgi:hypothetical protein
MPITFGFPFCLTLDYKPRSQGLHSQFTSHAVAASDVLQRALMLLVGVLGLLLDAHRFRCSSWCNMCSLFV